MKYALSALGGFAAALAVIVSVWALEGAGRAPGRAALAAVSVPEQIDAQEREIFTDYLSAGRKLVGTERNQELLARHVRRLP